MASPWIPSHQPPVERSWTGMALLLAAPLLSLVLLRMLWPASSVWFLTVGVFLLAAAAVMFLHRRTQEERYGRQTLAPEPSRVPLALAGIGTLFLALLFLPNFSGDDDRPAPARPNQVAQQPVTAGSQVLESSQPPAASEQPSAQPAQPAESVEGETYVVQDGDTLWDIAQRFETTVEAIIAANQLANPADLEIGQELIIPPAEAGAAEEEPAAAAQ